MLSTISSAPSRLLRPQNARTPLTTRTVPLPCVSRVLRAAASDEVAAIDVDQLPSASGREAELAKLGG